MNHVHDAGDQRLTRAITALLNAPVPMQGFEEAVASTLKAVTEADERRPGRKGLRRLSSIPLLAVLRRHKRRAVFTAAATVLMIAVGGWMLFLREVRPSADDALLEAKATGEFRVIREGSPVEATSPLARGDRIITGATGARVEIGGYCQLDLGSDTEIVLTGKPGDEALELANGRVVSHIDEDKGGFSVVTTLGSVRVVGTEFVTSVKTVPLIVVSVAVNSGVVSYEFKDATGRITAGERRTFIGTAPDDDLPSDSARNDDYREVIQLLAAGGGDVNAKDIAGRTPLHWASIKGQKDMAEILIARGADVNAEARGNGAIRPEENGCSYIRPLDYAWGNGHADVATLLMAKGGWSLARFIEAVRNNDLAAVRKELDAHPQRLKTKSYDRDPPLYVAAKAGHVRIVELLIDRGADVNRKDGRRGDRIENGKRVRGVGGRTALHRATKHGHKAVVQSLLARGADVNAQGSGGWTSLHIAAARGQKDIVELLIAAGADMNARCKATWGGFTALHLAIPKGHTSGDLSMAELLLAHGADPDIGDTYSETPLHWAARRGFKSLAERLIAKGANVNAKAFRDHVPRGYTPMDAAMNKDMAELLRKHGGVTNLR